MDKSNELEDLIANLCLNASTEDIKFCLRIYEYDKSISQIQKDMEKQRKPILRETSKYLRIPHFELKTKEALAHLIICRIQNLLPDDCALCRKRYSINILETPLLECAICGQGVHRKCWIQLAKSKSLLNQVTNDTMNADTFQGIFNPLNLPDLYYICTACKDNTIPESEAKCKPTEENEVVQNGENQHEENEENQRDGNEVNKQQQLDQQGFTQSHTESVYNDTQPDEHNNNYSEENTNQQNDQNQQREDRNVPICKFFLKGSCKHGLRGRGCNYFHPKKCKKFMEHGTRQPRGCNLGKSCKDFHPKMCLGSLRKGECFSESCHLNHIKGTQRVQRVKENMNLCREDEKTIPNFYQDDNTSANNKNNQAPEPNFLELIRLMKAEILQTLGEKMSVVTNQINSLQQQQMRVPPPMNYQFQLPQQNMIMRPQLAMNMPLNQQLLQPRFNLNH